VAIFNGDLENLREPGERLVDRVRCESALSELCGPVAIDFLNRDCVEPVTGKERKQVIAQRPLVIGHGARAKLPSPPVEPSARELVKGGDLSRPIDGLGLVRTPDAALNIGENVPQIGLSPLAVPSRPQSHRG